MSRSTVSVRSSLEEPTLSQTNIRSSGPKSSLSAVDSPPQIELVISGRVLDDTTCLGATHPARMKDNRSNVALIDENGMDGGTVAESQNRGHKFWLCIVALMMASFLIVLDMTGIGTALPTIVNDLHGAEFEWVGSAYGLASTAFLPLSGALAQTFGRKPVFLTQILLFGLGSALCGAATNMNFLIGGRVVQGIGAGGIASLTQIIISDLVPLKERGSFNGLIAVAYGLGTSMSSLTAGALAQRGHWRWFFYMNLPISGVTAVLVIFFLDLRVPKLSWREKLGGLDWIGNALVIIATTCIVLAVTWGGVTHPWSSVAVLIPLVVGILTMVLFFWYELNVPAFPVLPKEVVSTRTGVSGYLQAFFGNFWMAAAIYYLPLYFQACRSAGPIESAVDSIASSVGVMPFAFVTGISIAKSGAYRPYLWSCWGFIMLSSGVFSVLRANTHISVAVVAELLGSVGIGILQTSPIFPILAPIDVSLNANALAFFMFVRFLSQVWGISIGGTIIQNALQNKLSQAVLSTLPEGTSIVFSLVQAIPLLDEPHASTAKNDFAEAMQLFWRVLVGIGALGFLSSLLMKALPLHTAMDKNFAMEGNKKELNTVNANIMYTRA